jgi:cyclic beta-1,2-glucan synthetase
MAVAHFLADSNANVRSIDYIADRRSFLGRNHGLANPAVTPVLQAAPDRVAPHNPNNQLTPPAACACASAFR